MKELTRFGKVIIIPGNHDFNEKANTKEDAFGKCLHYCVKSSEEHFNPLERKISQCRGNNPAVRMNGAG